MGPSSVATSQRAARLGHLERRFELPDHRCADHRDHDRADRRHRHRVRLGAHRRAPGHAGPRGRRRPVRRGGRPPGDLGRSSATTGTTPWSTRSRAGRCRPLSPRGRCATLSSPWSATTWSSCPSPTARGTSWASSTPTKYSAWIRSSTRRAAEARQLAGPTASCVGRGPPRDTPRSVVVFAAGSVSVSSLSVLWSLSRSNGSSSSRSMSDSMSSLLLPFQLTSFLVATVAPLLHAGTPSASGSRLRVYRGRVTGVHIPEPTRSVANPATERQSGRLGLRRAVR